MAIELPGVVTDRVTRTVYATDNSIYQVEPHGVALPSSAAQVRALLAANHASTDPRPIAARGAGTGTNGQSLTDGVLIDLKRRLDRIVSIDPDAATVVVEPGVVASALDAELAPHGLFWAPHTSTLNRCTVGGMIATDAAGKGSLVHGRAHRHVRALDVVLDDGTPWRAEPMPLDEAKQLAAAGDRTGALWRSLLDLPLVEAADYGLPELARGFSGYGIDRVRRDGLIDPVPLLCGSEGTLAVITSAELALTPLPAHTVLVVASYDSFALALDDAVDLAATAPSAIESFDETTLERGRSSPAWPALGEVVGDDEGSVLLLEYSGADVPDVDAALQALAATTRSRAVRVVTDPVQRAAAWKVRADAVGLLAKVATGGPELSARPTAMVEDCAVPVAAMPAFIAGFRKILDDADLTYGMFGHADVGCVHVRPALDLTDPDHERLVRTITDRVADLVAQHGGVLWGEHGRGFRGDVVSSVLTPETIEIMRMVKTAFDPGDLLNPGKLYRPLGRDEPITPLDAPPLRGHRNRTVSVTLRREFADAYACNGNGLCHHYDRAEVMCPSYKATGDPALSPKGRADLLREYLASAAAAEAGGPSADPGFDDAVVDNLDQCLSCSACTGHCPVEVDIPELKSRFLERHYANHRRPLSHLLLSRFETLAGLAGSVPGPVAKLGTRPLARLLGLVDLPVPPRRPRAIAALRAYEPETAADVVILPDVFTARLEPSTLVAAVAVLERLGHVTAVAPLTPSGKFDHVKGRRRAFATAAAAQAEHVAEVLASGAVPVVVEPAIALLHGHEYPAINPGHPQGVRYLGEVIADRVDRLDPVAEPRSITLLGHCTERALAPAWLDAWTTVLAGVGHTVSDPAVGCCGMAGVFGHERENQAMSRRLFDLTWAGHIVDAAEGTVVATGYSCRSQAKRLAAGDLSHPVHLLA
ncbi:MAG: FAD-binding oxidoreductase [Acidimicrobiia bacterium]|nr:FAD-binding oxidoreductase [Acidimicrobiia bacterium]